MEKKKKKLKEISNFFLPFFHTFRICDLIVDLNFCLLSAKRQSRRTYILKLHKSTKMATPNAPPNGIRSKRTETKSQYKSRTADVTPEQLRKIKGYRLMAAGAIFLIVPSLELYRRLYAGGERRIQQGEWNPLDGTIKQWEEEEKIKNFKSSWLTRIFGEK